MAREIVVTPYLATEQLPVLKSWIHELDHALENPRHTPQPIAQTGLLEQIGAMLWTAAGLNADDVRSAIEQAREFSDLLYQLPPIFAPYPDTIAPAPELGK